MKNGGYHPDVERVIKKIIRIFLLTTVILVVITYTLITLAYLIRLCSRINWRWKLTNGNCGHPEKKMIFSHNLWEKLQNMVICKEWASL